MGSRIVWSIVTGFLLGVFVRSFLPLGTAYVVFCLLLAVAILCLTLADRKLLRLAVLIAVALIAFAGGIIRMHNAVLAGDPALDRHLDTKVTIVGIVSAEPDVRENGERLSLRVTQLLIGSSTVPVRSGVLVLAPPHSGINYGDEITATGTLRVPEAFETSAGRSFNYPTYLAKDGIGYELAFAQIEANGKNSGNPIIAAAIGAKQLYLAGERAALPEPEAGLAGGITVGDKRSVGAELSADFQRVSLIHMIVLSGYNITVVMNAVRWMLQLLPRSAQYSGIGAAVIFFVLMAGGAASAVRAGAMALIAVFARATGRVFIAGRILGVVAFAMVLWNPFTLAFDPSFQLSALATIGLISFTPLFAARLGWVTERFGLREILASTLATQLVVLPLLLYQNGSLSIVALPANLLALIPVPAAMLASAGAAIGGVLFGSWAVPLAAPAYVMLAYIIAVARFFASLPFAAVSVPEFSAVWMFAAYGVLGASYLYAKKRTDLMTVVVH